MIKKIYTYNNIFTRALAVLGWWILAVVFIVARTIAGWFRQEEKL